MCILTFNLKFGMILPELYALTILILKILLQVFADFKALTEEPNPAFYIHVIQKLDWCHQNWTDATKKLQFKNLQF